MRWQQVLGDWLPISSLTGSQQPITAPQQPVNALSCWEDTPCDPRFVESAFPGPWEANILSPASRVVSPPFVLVPANKTGEDTSTDDFIPGPGGHPLNRLRLGSGDAPPLQLVGNGSQLVLDFGLEVGGRVTLSYAVVGPSGGALGLAFSETSELSGQWSDASNGGLSGPDGALYDTFAASEQALPHTYTMPPVSLRGGFRYLTLFLVLDDPDDRETAVFLLPPTLDIVFQPTWPSLRAYQGFFDSNDDVLNRAWYACAYTLQTNSIPPTTGRQYPLLTTGWANDALLGPGDTILVDGAKRDRAVWPGDMGVAVPSMALGTGDMESVKNSLQTLYDNQNADGSLPMAGPPLLLQGSDTYHLATLIGTYQYMLYTDDAEFLATNWRKYRLAMAYITAKQTYDSGLLHVTGTGDWARYYVGTNMTEAQVLLYYALTTGAELVTWYGSALEMDTTAATAVITDWSAAAARLREAIRTYCYDDVYGAFRDNADPDNSLYPQDANSLALATGLVNRTERASAHISARLRQLWGPFGPSAPELPGEVAPFSGSWEVRGHLAAGQTTRALKLVRRLWGGYLDRADGTQSTMVEGLLADDGTFAYRFDNGYGGANNDPAVAASYTSHSHGWSAGPTSALTEFVVGLAVTARAGHAWRFAPQFGDLTRAQGGFVTPRGRFRAAWQLATTKCAADGRTCRRGYTATVSTPKGTSGKLILPVDDVRSTTLRVVINNQPLSPDQYRLQASNSFDVHSTVEISAEGGHTTIHVDM